tara:strand:+ start:7572 stop:7748 length:177 start_codon:yes stop_codon:yes gene_type:complete
MGNSIYNTSLYNFDEITLNNDILYDFTDIEFDKNNVNYNGNNDILKYLTYIDIDLPEK